MSVCHHCLIDKEEFQNIEKDLKTLAENAIEDQKVITELQTELENARKANMVSKGTIVSIEPFLEDKMDWDLWIERLELFFVANGIEESFKVSTFLTL